MHFVGLSLCHLHIQQLDPGSQQGSNYADNPGQLPLFQLRSERVAERLDTSTGDADVSALHTINCVFA